VKIHKDGRVKAGGYQQKSALVAAKEGVVDGDKIVREFKFGTQYLYMKEDGFRQETVITRPPTTAEAKYLIASESGELPSKYKRSDITAVDADGAVHEFVNLGQFKKWLDKASYPVTIDPDFAETSTVDAHIYAISPDTNYGASNPMRIGVASTTQYYRGLWKFDVSSIPSGSVVSAASLTLNCSAATDNSKHSYLKIYRQLKAWVEAEVTWNIYSTGNNWTSAGGFNASDCEQTEIGSADVTIAASYTIALTASKIQEWISGTLTNNGLFGKEQEDNGNTNSYKRYDSSENGTAGNRPLLSVTYTTGGALRRINTSSFQQLTGGIHG
jgi:hypothetical protein